MSMPTLSPQTETKGQLRTLVWSTFIVWTLLSATYAGVIGALLPDQVQTIDPANKVGNLAIVSTISSIVTLFAQPIVGAFSDRTRSKLGRRAPWMLIGAGAAAVLLLGLSSAKAIIWVTIFWVLAQVCLNALQGPMTAVMPDRVPVPKRGFASGVFGFGQLLGTALGVLVASQLVKQLGIAYGAFGAAVLVATVAFVLVNRDYSTLNMERPAFSWSRFVKGFWVSPLKHPDYGWAFAARFAMVIAYQGFQTYLLYILEDYVGLSNSEALAMMFPVTGVFLGFSALTSVVGGSYSDRIGRRKVFVFAASAVMAGALVIPLVWVAMPGMFVFAAVFGVGYGCYLSVDAALMSQVLPGGGSDAAKDLGILNVATNIPQALTPAIAWFLVDLLDLGYGAIFGAGIVFAIIGAFAILPIKSVR